MTNTLSYRGKRKEQARNADIRTENEALWDRTFNFPVREVKARLNVAVHLSDTERGKCQVIIRSGDGWGFGLKAVVWIEQLRALLEWAGKARDELREYN